jgi:hypothetical protein
MPPNPPFVCKIFRRRGYASYLIITEAKAAIPTFPGSSGQTARFVLHSCADDP